MTVESAHLSAFHINNHIMMMNTLPLPNQPNATNLYNYPLGYGIDQENLLPIYNSGFAEFVNPVKAEDSGLTCSLPVSRKRSRDYAQDQMDQHSNFMFLGQDISMQIQQQQLEIDQLVANHMEKVKTEVQERRKRSSGRIIAAIEEGLSKNLRAKQEEVVRIAKLNFSLEEKLKSLCVENQIWREVAQTHEATANALRSNLNQVLEHVVQDDYWHRSTTAACVEDAVALADDVQSCCESNNEQPEQVRGNDECISSSSNNNKRWCKKCGKEESCVLLLPCRHLCLCTVCASSVNICPLCKSAKNISVLVNMS